MLKMKNDNGVTLTALVVTIIVLMIILTISVDLGVSSINSTKDRKLQAELEMVQQACISEYTKAKQMGLLESADIATKQPANFIGKHIQVGSLPTLSTGWVLSTEPTVSYKWYFEVDPDKLEELDILDSEYTYIINYYTGEVYNVTKRESSEHVPLYIKSVTTHPEDSSGDTTSFVDSF